MTAAVPFEIESLLAQARERTGLGDFGDASFRDGLARLVDGLEAEAALSPLGRVAAETMLASQLANRLRVEDWWRGHPELTNERIERPLFIVGMSRSGTTALSHLLACDPANRSLLHWETADSVPPPETATYYSDPRFEAARKSADALAGLDPGFRAIHYDPPDMPVECLVSMAQHYVSLHYPSMYFVPRYARWVLGHDHGPVYRWHRRLLQLLQSKKPGRWQLKSPHHAISLPGWWRRSRARASCSRTATRPCAWPRPRAWCARSRAASARRATTARSARSGPTCSQRWAKASSTSPRAATSIRSCTCPTPS
jgi:hypothetical protein